MLCVLDASPALAAPVYTISPFAGTGTAGPPTAGPALSSELHNPDQVAVGSNGDVYIADQSNYEVEQVTPSGALSIIAGTGTRNPPTPGPATSSHLTNPAGLAVDSAGNVYISDENSGEVVMVTPSGMLSIIAGTGTQGTPTPGPATSSELGSPEGLALDAGGDLYIADNVNREVLEVTPSGTLSIVAGTGASGTPAPGPATSSPLGSPDGLAVDASGNLYIADADGYVEKVTPSGTLSIIAGNGNYGNPTPGPARSSDLGEPYGIAVDAAGNVDIADGIDIEQVSPDGTLSVIAGNNTGAAPTYGGPAVKRR
jgi:DNA-binding beta-propeller fold protein YncE